jgi:hypothetical protein
MSWKFSPIVLPLAALAPPVYSAPETVTATQAACDEQAGEFQRSGGVASCIIDGVVYWVIERAPREVKPCLERSQKRSGAVPLTPKSATLAVRAATPGHC